MTKFIILIMALILPLHLALAVGKIQNEDVKSKEDIHRSVSVISGNISIGSACITSPSSTTGLFPGLYVYDITTPANIPNGTTVVALPGTCSAGQIQMSQVAGFNGTQAIAFGGQTSQLINDTKIYVTGNSLNKPLDQVITDGDLSGGGGISPNLLTSSANPGFEGGTTNWTASGGSFTINSATPIFGANSASFDASALNQTLSSILVPIPIGIRSTPCLAASTYSYAGSSGDYKLQVFDGTSVVAETSLPTAASPIDSFIKFTCPASGSILIRLIANVVNPGAIRWDGATKTGGSIYLGSNFTELSWSGYLNTSSGWDTSSTSEGDFNAGSGISIIERLSNGFGSVTAAGSSLPGITFTPPKTGYYVVTVGVNYNNGSGGGGVFLLTDGSNNILGTTESSQSISNAVFPVYLTGMYHATSLSPVTFKIRGRLTGAGTTAIGANLSGSANGLEFNVISM